MHSGWLCRELHNTRYTYYWTADLSQVLVSRCAHHAPTAWHGLSRLCKECDASKSADSPKINTDLMERVLCDDDARRHSRTEAETQLLDLFCPCLGNQP